MLAAIVEEQRLGAALAFVIAGAWTDRVHVAPVLLDLRVDMRIAVNLAGRGLQDGNAQPLGQPQHVDRADHTGLGRLHWVELIVHRRGRAGEIVYLVDLDIERKRHIVAHQLEIGMVQQARDIGASASEEIVDAEHMVALLDDPGTQVRADEAGAASDQNALLNRIAARAIIFSHVKLVPSPVPSRRRCNRHRDRQGKPRAPMHRLPRRRDTSQRCAQRSR